MASVCPQENMENKAVTVDVPQQDPLLTRQTVFALLRSCLWGQERYPFTVPEGMDWQAVYQELLYQCIACLPVDLLVREDPKNRNRYMYKAMTTAAFHRKVMTLQQTLIRRLTDAGIPCVILKGAAAACYYPRPEYRAMGDVDLLVRPEDYEKALELLSTDCNVCGKEEDRVTKLEKDQVVIELHRQFAVFNDEQAGKTLDGWILGAFDGLTEKTLSGCTFPMLPERENGLVLLMHIQHHLVSGLGLRQIVDWMLYVHCQLDDRYYREVFEPMLEQLQLRTLAVTVTRMCQMYLGLGQEITWCREADEQLCEQLMNHLWESGNFGYKQGTRNSSTLVVLNVLRNVTGFFGWLQRYGCENWQALKKHPWLKPFAWFYQICRFVRKGFASKNPIRSLLQNVRKEKNLDQMMDRLEIPRKYK